MRILYLTQWFEPESQVIKGLKFARGLQAAGHEVTVVTGFPKVVNFPSGVRTKPCGMSLGRL